MLLEHKSEFALRKDTYRRYGLAIVCLFLVSKKKTQNNRVITVLNTL